MLANIEDDYQKIMGYIKLSLNLVMSHDKRATLTAEKPEEKIKGESIRGLSIPPQFKLERKQIKVCFYLAERLVQMDSSWTQGKSSDPFVKLSLGGTSIKSEVIKNARGKAFFYEILYITMIYPTFVDSLTLNLKDKEEYGKKSEVFGSTNIKIHKIANGDYKLPFWQYIYGAHTEFENKEAHDDMNLFPELAARFKGALYLSLEMVEAKQQGNFKTKMANEQIIRPPLLTKFRICLEMYGIHNVHYKDQEEKGNHYMNIDWGGKMIQSKNTGLNCGMLEYYQYLVLEEEFACESLDLLPDIIISVVKQKKDQHVSYYRISPKSIAGSLPISDKYYMMNVDKAVDALQDDGAGILHMKMAVDRVDRWFSENYSNFDQNLVRPKVSPVVIALNVFQAKQLPSGDDDGSGDPVVVAYHYGTLARSTIFNKTLNPIWNERLLIPTYIVGKFIPPLIVNVHDYDEKTIGKGDFEFLGGTQLFLNSSNLAQDYSKIPEPSWHKLKYSQDSKMGEISLSVTIINAAERADNLRPRVVKMNQVLTDHMIKIRILGLRNLQSAGLIPVKKPYIKINTSSLLDRSKQSDSKEDIPFTDLTTIPKFGGENPNITEILK